MQKKVLLVTPGLCGVCKNLSILLAIRQCGVRNKISELFLLCFLLGAALESLYIGDKTICPPYFLCTPDYNSLHLSLLLWARRDICKTGL